jgi:hypothetical protein
VLGGLDRHGRPPDRREGRDANRDWWIHVPTKQTVTSLPFLPAARETGTIAGQPGTQLESYLADTVTVPAETIASSESSEFATP